MKPAIMVLEDQGSVSRRMRERLSRDYVVLSANGIPKARKILDENDVKCLVVDLNLPARGLTEEQKPRTKNGRFSGWIWLVDEVFPARADMRRRTVIYSAFLKDFYSAFDETDYEDIVRIGKTVGGGRASDLIEAVSRCVGGVVQ